MNSRFLSALTIIAGLGLSIAAHAQDETDAHRYSFLSPQGTARSIGIGGALGSIGGDFTSLSVNPAGIGVYRSSELMFTPSIKINNVSGTYQNTTMDDNAVRFNFNNLGVVFTGTAKGKRYERAKWKSVSFGLGLNRLADFNRNVMYGGVNNTSSFSEVFVTDAIFFPDDVTNLNTPAGIGWNSFLIDEDSLGYFNVVPVGIDLNQRRAVQERGGINEIAISLGGNYMEQFMIGATLGLPSLSYRRDMTFTEEDASNDATNNFRSLEYNESLSTSGLGINLKLGFIYKPTDAFRVGAALHTPTYFGLTDVQNRSISTNTEGFKALIGDNTGPVTTLQSGLDIPENIFEYGLTTPWRGILSATGFLGTFGFITADYEYVDYRSARFHFDNSFAADEAYINQLIKNRYKAASNFRIGAEGRLDNLMIRLGFGYYGNPDNSGGDDRMVFSTGLGYRFDNWFMDLGFSHTSYQDQEQPYAVQYPENYFLNNPSGTIAVPKAAVKGNANNIALTVGWKF